VSDAPLYSARVRTTEAMVRRAVRVFLWRRVYARSWLWLGVVALLFVSVVVEAGSVAVLAVACAIGGIFLWLQWANTLKRVRRMTPPEANVTFAEAKMTLSSSAGRATLAWPDCTEMWDLGGVLMLFSAPFQFILLPLDGLSPEMVAFVRARLPRSRAA